MTYVLSQNDYQVLSRYQFKGRELYCTQENRKKNDSFLVVDTSGGEKKLATVHRKTLSLWSIVLGFFGYGALANKQYRLTQVSNYLVETYGNSLSTLSNSDQSYKTIHAIASRELAYKKEGDLVPRLWKAISDSEQTFRFERTETVFRKRCGFEVPEVTTRSYSHYTLPLTKETTVGHVAALGKVVENGKFYAHNSKRGVSHDSKDLSGLAFTSTYDKEYKEILTSHLGGKWHDIHFSC